MSPAARSRRSMVSRRQEASWARRSGQVAVLPLLARQEAQCGACLWPVVVGDRIAKFMDAGEAWWGHVQCVTAARGEWRPP